MSLLGRNNASVTDLFTFNKIFFLLLSIPQLLFCRTCCKNVAFTNGNFAIKQYNAAIASKLSGFWNFLRMSVYKIHEKIQFLIVYELSIAQLLTIYNYITYWTTIQLLFSNPNPKIYYVRAGNDSKELKKLLWWSHFLKYLH